MKLREPPPDIRNLDMTPILRVVALCGENLSGISERYRLDIGGHHVTGKRNVIWYDLWTDAWKIKCRAERRINQRMVWTPVSFGGDVSRCMSDLMLVKCFQ